ncbi:tetratricopeptide repeat protein [Micromonospora sp. WMMD987]|uniref:tetratricopeptide repeat protein n=1 Tax=Micromonospora sp. WMMD987 TaxID=3016089 RepID=UPI00249A0ABB|nr:tetratricopeptide repeat protein [Micromonospora sp. WMMD987]WFE97521.1 hypothetical protein O7612_11905 [Micromonospora sp. WMMD987]
MPVEPGALKDLKDAIYRLYVDAGRPTLDVIAADVASLADELDLPGAPGRDTINRIIGDGRLPPGRADTIATAVVLAHAAGRRDTAVLAADIGALWTRAAGTPVDSRIGRPVRQCDPLALEVHPAIQLDRPLPPLPPYVERRHDHELAKIVGDAASGRSRIAMLVGASSTGKTRACWEAIQRLPAQWRVWHPFDPTRPDAADQQLAQVPGYTVVWFNEAQHYLLTTDPRLGERVAARLRTLLRDPARGPVLVLGTIWPYYWDSLTGPPPANDLDLHAQARELLNGADIAVPDVWAAEEVRQLAATSDERLRDAATNAEAGRITQYLAGVPELMQRYRNAPPPVRAVLTAAVDARRLGHPLSLPHDLLALAAPSYLADVEWNQLTDDWWQEALAYTARPCHGIAGPLVRIRPRPTEPGTASAVCYRLADYLQQRGAAERAAAFPPAGFWDAVATSVSDPVTLRAIGDHAERRGRYRRAAALYALAVNGGDDEARWALAALREQAGDQDGAAALRHDRATTVDEAGQLAASAELRERDGDLPGAIDLYQQAADRGDAQSWYRVVSLLEQTADPAGALVSALRAADRGLISALRILAVTRDRLGDPAGAEQVARLAADRGDATIFGTLGATREGRGDIDTARGLYQRGADHGDASALWSLADLLRRSGLGDRADKLQQEIDRGTPSALMTLAALRERMGDGPAARHLYQRAADRGSVAALLSLAALHERDGDVDAAEKWYRRAIAQGDVTGLWSLAGLRHQAGDLVGAVYLYRRAADHGITAALVSLAELAGEQGDRAQAESWALLATDHGDRDGLPLLIRLRRRAGDHAAAARMERFGLEDDGSPASAIG